MSIKEFTKAAKIYDSGKSGIYEMCKYDYPKVLKELKIKISPFLNTRYALSKKSCGLG